MRNTKQSNLVLDIVNSSCNHPTAYDVYMESIKIIPNISLTTVYRNLNKLVEKRLIQRFELKDNIVRYDKNTCHDHFICTCCGNVYDLERSNIMYDDMIDGIASDRCHQYGKQQMQRFLQRLPLGQIARRVPVGFVRGCKHPISDPKKQHHQNAHQNKGDLNLIP